MLSPQEQEIAKTLGFEDQVLELVKEALSPEMVIMTTDGFEEDQSGLRPATHSSTVSLLEKDRQQYEKIKREYPELESVIEAALAREKPGEQRILLIQFGQEKRNRHQKLVAAIYPYIRLRFQSPNRIAESAHFVDAAMKQALESDSDLEEDPTFKLRPGAVVTPVGDRLWSINLPTRYTAQAYRRLASIINFRECHRDKHYLEKLRARQSRSLFLRKRY